MFGRGAEWRQGDLIDLADSFAIPLDRLNESNEFLVVVISHDCDIASDKEENIEFMLCCECAKFDPQLASAKQVRNLQLAYENDADASKNYFSLSRDGFRQAPKVLMHGAVVKENLTISENEKQSLKVWLAARYGRPAFPNEFEDRLRAQFSGRYTVEKKIAKILATHQETILGVYFDLRDDRSQELEAGSPYELGISIVYDSIEFPDKGLEVATDAVAEIEKVFTKVYGDSQQIELVYCDAVASTHFSIADARKADLWRLDYISLTDGVDPIDRTNG